MMLQLNPPLPMDTPKGLADAHFLIDYGSEAHLLFVTFVRETGECWTWPAKDIRLEKNVTGGIRTQQKTDESSEQCAPTARQSSLARLRPKSRLR